jgi:hypothetical protein
MKMYGAMLYPWEIALVAHRIGDLMGPTTAPKGKMSKSVWRPTFIP